MEFLKKLLCVLLVLGFILEPSLLYAQQGSFEFKPREKEKQRLEQSYDEFVEAFLKINSKQELDLKELQDYLLDLNIYIKKSLMATDQEISAGTQNSSVVMPGYVKFGELQVLQKKIAEYLWTYSLIGEIKNAEARFIVYSSLLSLKKELKSFFKSRKPTGSAIDSKKIVSSVMPENYDAALILADFGEKPVDYKALHRDLYYAALDNVVRIYYSNIYIYGEGAPARGFEAAEELCEDAGEECLTAVKKAVNAQAHSLMVKGVKRLNIDAVRRVVNNKIIPEVNKARKTFIKKAVIKTKQGSVNTMQEYDTNRFDFYLDQSSPTNTSAIEAYWKQLDEIIKKYPESRFLLGDRDQREALLKDPDDIFQRSITDKKYRLNIKTAEYKAKHMEAYTLRDLSPKAIATAFESSQEEIEEYAEKIISDHVDTQEESRLPVIMQNTSKFLERITYLTRTSPFTTSAVFIAGGERLLGAVDEIDRSISLQKEKEKDAEQIKRVLGIAGLVIGAVLLCTGILTIVGKTLITFSAVSLMVIEGVALVSAIAFGVVTGYETFNAIDEFTSAQMALAEQITLTFGDEGYVDLAILKELDERSSQALNNAIIDGAFTVISLLVLPEILNFAKVIGRDVNKLVRSYSKLCNKYKGRTNSEVFERALVYASAQDMSEKELKALLLYLEKNPKSRLYASMEQPLGPEGVKQIKGFKEYNYQANRIYKLRENPLIKNIGDIKMEDVYANSSEQLKEMRVVVEERKHVVTYLEEELEYSLESLATKFLEENSDKMKVFEVLGGEGLGVGTASPYELTLLHPDFKAYYEYINARGGSVIIDPSVKVTKVAAYFRPSGNFIAIEPNTLWHQFVHEFSHFRLNYAFEQVQKLSKSMNKEFYCIGMRFTKEDLLLESVHFKDFGPLEYVEGLKKIKTEFPELKAFAELMNETGLQANLTSINEIIAVRDQVRALREAGFEFSFESVNARKYAESWLQYDLYNEWLKLSPNNVDFITPKLEESFTRSQLATINLNEMEKLLIEERGMTGNLDRLLQPPLIMRSADGKTLVAVIGSGMIVAREKE